VTIAAPGASELIQAVISMKDDGL